MEWFKSQATFPHFGFLFTTFFGFKIHFHSNMKIWGHSCLTGKTQGKEGYKSIVSSYHTIYNLFIFFIVFLFNLTWWIHQQEAWTEKQTTSRVLLQLIFQFLCVNRQVSRAYEDREMSRPFLLWHMTKWLHKYLCSLARRTTDATYIFYIFPFQRV